MTSTGSTAITDITAVGVPVLDQDRALEFYVGTLGFEKRMDAPFGENSRWIEVVPPGATTAISLLLPSDVGKSEGTLGGETGISLATHDIQATYEDLTSKGVTFTGPPQTMPWGMKATWFTDPDGNSFFLSEAPPL